MTESTLRQALETMNRQQAADYFGVHLATVKRAIKRFNIDYKKKSGGHYLYKDRPLDDQLLFNEKQLEILTGSLLGDGYINSRYKTFGIKQKLDNKDYVEQLHLSLSPFSTPVRTEKSRKPTRLKNGKISHKLEDWNGEFCYSASFGTRQHAEFRRLREKWYPEGIKVVPPDLELTPTVVAHWYVQDGHNNKARRYHRISTQSFKEYEVVRLSTMLNDMLGTKSDVQLHEGGFVIYITHTNGRDMLSSLLREHVTYKCFAYKLN